MYHAYISVIPKKGRDNLQCGNYRPISLLKLDMKIFTKVIVRRLTALLQKIIHLDLMGFLKGREIRDSTIRTINVLHRIQRLEKEACLLPMDAEKAFDCVGWLLMLQTLEAKGIVAKMRTWITNLYSVKAQIRVKQDTI